MGAGLPSTTKSTVAGWVDDRWTSDERDSLSTLGRVEDNNDDADETVDPSQAAKNPLCPGAIRGKDGQPNPLYEHTFVFENDYPALQANIPDANPDNQEKSDDLFQCHSARGVCKVICFHPNSKLTLPRMSLGDIAHVVRTWIDVFEELARTYAWVQIFENRGDIMGCSSKIEWKVDSIEALIVDSRSTSALPSVGNGFSSERSSCETTNTTGVFQQASGPCALTRLHRT